MVAGVNRFKIAVVNRSLTAARAVPRMRSTRPGGSIRSLRQRASSASRSRSSDSSTGAISSASQPASLASSSSLKRRNRNARRIWAR